MAGNQKLPKLTFTITPNANGYLVGCNEIPNLFTDAGSVVDIDTIVRDLILEYVDSFPEDAQKKGIRKDIPTQTIWRGSPNSVALE